MQIQLIAIEFYNCIILNNNTYPSVHSKSNNNLAVLIKIFADLVNVSVSFLMTEACYIKKSAGVF